MDKQKVIISTNLETAVTNAVEECEHDRIFILVDETTQRLCLPLIGGFNCLRGADVIVIGATDENKTLESLTHVWSCLQQGGATRHSLMVNLGGGMVTDLGGFAASTFKRGMNYINISTTLLAMVDASVGGKTGINFGGLKNEIGVFSTAKSVILDTRFLRTMDHENICSGYAEMLKHGLISDEEVWAELINFDLNVIDYHHLSRMLENSVKVKERIVEEDPTERGIRKALNLGHTVGHAFESLALKRKPILHGYAVAYGLICELYLSHVKTGFPIEKMRQTVRFITDVYGRMPVTCDDYPTLLELMTHDKKNVGSDINFTLLGGVGDIRINQTATKQEIEEALDFYREGF
ncbi:MAG: 3-dehydroquinate synthase [Prevotella sp.]|nr:3-dehydroquinate synthase [Prevotella sp.]